ncbi:uncharacterized protein LOC126367858 [Pectinophora gossypiella]|uniref:uncharacterized protein LOC126367858 n=1 Tax=Pectinophora gossypiella TaxID=13191 RepID=UPI00214F3E71|nr:uncharacterized protein LOC126367858 [Pectinophora gossypiella]
MRTMLILACIVSALAVAAAAPATYDQRQDGDFNVRADVQNVVLVVAMPQKMSLPADILDFLKHSKRNRDSEIQDRADIHVMEAFVEPSEPYHVEIGETRNAGGDGRAVEVVIAGRRRLEAEPQPEQDEYKLIGATEQCGPDRERDPVTLACRARAALAPAEEAPAPVVDPSLPQPDNTLPVDSAPEVLPASS